MLWSKWDYPVSVLYISRPILKLIYSTNWTPPKTKRDNRFLLFHWTGLSSICAVAVLNAASRCRRFFSQNNEQHEANLPPLSLYIYNSARLVTFSCAHLEDRTNRNKTIPYQKPGYLTTVSSADFYLYIYLRFTSVNKITSSHFQEVKSHVRDVSMGSTAVRCWI